VSAVVHVVVAGEIGGAERMLVDLARSGGRKHVIALMTPNESLRALFQQEGLDVEDRGPVREDALAYLARTLGGREVAWLGGVLARRKATIVHLHTFGSQVVGARAALRAGAKIVRTEHSTRVYDDPSCWPFSRWSLARADVAVCISEHVREVARAKAPWAAPKLRVVPNGVDTTRFAPSPLPARSGSEPLRFVAVGRLEPRKGFDIALDALAQVPGAELVIVGEGEARAALEAQASRLGVAARVRFTGFAADVREHVAAAHVALSSARAEGLGIALIEAMAMQRPVVALPTGGVPELVRDGATGWLAHGGDAAALARIMRDAVESGDELGRRGERARELVLARFSLGAMRAAYEEIYGGFTAPGA
jgi:L-malate glycosyltransferase